MKNRVIKLILIIALAVVFTACSSEDRESTAKDTSDSPVTDKTTEGTTENNTEIPTFVTINKQIINQTEQLEQIYEGSSFSMGITGEWKHSYKSNVDFFGIEGKNVQMSVVADVSGMTASLEECKTQLSMLYNNTEGYEVISVGDIILNANEGIIINYRFEKEENIYQGRQLAVQKDDVFYVITFLTLQEEFSDYEEEVMKMISSFNIK